MVILTMVAFAGYGQGLLIEGASKLLHAVLGPKPESISFTIPANFIPAHEAEGENFSFNTVRFDDMDMEEFMLKSDSEVEVLISFHVNSLEVSYENALCTESWMAEPFSNELEETAAVESWMAEPFSNELEETSAVESWMAESFSNELEETVAVESWMAEALYEGVETGIEVEYWMTEPLVHENEIVTEDWMSTLLR